MSDIDNNQDERAKSFLGDLVADPNEPTSFDPPDDDTQEPAKSEDVDTKPETSEPEDTKPETTVQPDVNELFEELGLKASYKDPTDALRRLREKDRYITQLEQERSRLRNAKSEEPPKPTDTSAKIDIEKLLESDDPVELLATSGGFVRKQDVANYARQIVREEFTARETERSYTEYEEFIRNTNDYHKVEPYIEKLIKENPGLGNLPPGKGIQLVYKLAKLEMGDMPVKQVVDKADPDKKSRAETSGGKTQTKTNSPKTLGGFTQDQLNKMSLEEIEAKVGFGD